MKQWMTYPNVASLEATTAARVAAITSSITSRMTTPPDGARTTVINTFVNSLIANNVWDQMVGIYILAAADAQASLINWKADEHNLTAVNSPTFVADAGYTSNGTSSYLNTVTLIPDSATFQNNHHFSTWSNTNVTGSGVDGGTTRLFICGRVSGSGIQHTSAAGGTAPTTATADSIGMVTISRNNSATYDVYKAGSLLEVETQTSAGFIAATPITLLARGTTGAPSLFSTRQISAVTFGYYLTDAQQLVLHNALAAYRTSVGL